VLIKLAIKACHAKQILSTGAFCFLTHFKPSKESMMIRFLKSGTYSLFSVVQHV